MKAEIVAYNDGTYSIVQILPHSCRTRYMNSGGRWTQNGKTIPDKDCIFKTISECVKALEYRNTVIKDTIRLMEVERIQHQEANEFRRTIGQAMVQYQDEGMRVYLGLYNNTIIQ